MEVKEDSTCNENKEEITEVKNLNRRRKKSLVVVSTDGVLDDNGILVNQITEGFKLHNVKQSEVDRMVKMMIQKDKDDDSILSGEDVRACLSLSGVKIGPVTVSRLLRVAMAGTRRYSIETIGKGSYDSP